MLERVKTAAAATLAALLALSCGVKGPPLPPIPAAAEKSVDRPVEAKASPSPR